MAAIEVEVHSFLRDFLRSQREVSFHHHLSMARLVARALRLNRSALMQTGSASGYSLSYLAPALLWQEAVILVAPVYLQQRLIQVEIPQLQQWLGTEKTVTTQYPSDWNGFQGLLLVAPEGWLAEKTSDQSIFPPGIPTLIDRADNLEEWARRQLTATIAGQDWNQLMAQWPHLSDPIRDCRVRLTQAIFAHPPNPYECYLLDLPEQRELQHLFALIGEHGSQLAARLPNLARFAQQWLSSPQEQLLWAKRDRHSGQCTLYCTPVTVAEVLHPIWKQQPVVLIGSFLDWDNDATTYRQQLGLEDLTCLKFSPSRQHEHIQLYVPQGIPLPNTPHFQQALLQQLQHLIAFNGDTPRPIVAIVGDMPLRERVATSLAAQFGSRVQVETTHLEDNGILICGWEFWQEHQEVLPSPCLLIVATLPIPSLEHPLVAGRVAYYKHHRQDWFRLYLLPTAIRELQRAIAPLRETQGTVALLDLRLERRSYGQQIYRALEPCIRSDRLEDLRLEPEILETD